MQAYSELYTVPQSSVDVFSLSCCLWLIGYLTIGSSLTLGTSIYSVTNSRLLLWATNSSISFTVDCVET